MTRTFVALQEWLNKRSARDRFYMFLMGFVVLYLIYFIVFLRPVLAEKRNLLQQITTLQTQQVLLQQQIEELKKITRTPVFMQLYAQQQRLAAQIAKLQNQFENLKPALFSPQDLPNLTKQILNQNVALISLTQLPIEPWPPNIAEEKTNLLDMLPGGLYQHTMQIEFQNDFFNTITYLKNLENISAYMYWDSMDYKVLEHPKADVVIKFHVLSQQKS